MGGAIRRIGKKKIVGAVLALLPGLGFVESPLHAQGPQTAIAATPGRGVGDARIRLKSRVFRFPIHIEKASQPRIREVVLFMREGQTGEWVRVDSVPPTTASIRCQVPHDGEFCFQVQTIDIKGVAYPAHLNQQAPAMIVMVDTSDIQVSPTLVQGPATVPPPLPFPAQAEIATNVLPAESPVITMSPPRTATPSPAVMPVANQVVMPAAMPSAPARAVNQAQSIVTPGQSIINPGQSIVNPGRSTVIEKGTAPTVSAAVAASSPVNRQFYNTTHVGIDYNVARMPPSGLGRVEVWATQDQGRTWHKVGDNQHQHSPAEADLPGEGSYGIRLVATNGNGFGGKAPSAGDAPAINVEIDLTGPVVHSLDVDPVAKNGTLDLHWPVTDKNLAGDCINLYFASQRSGPWTAIAYKVKNDEVYHWALPRMSVAALFPPGGEGPGRQRGPLRNAEPTTMLDMTEPDLNVIGVSTMPQRGGPPNGN